MGNEKEDETRSEQEGRDPGEHPVPSQAEGDLETIEEDLKEKSKLALLAAVRAEELGQGCSDLCLAQIGAHSRSPMPES
jgi:hypothetical protein